MEISTDTLSPYNCSKKAQQGMIKVPNNQNSREVLSNNILKKHISNILSNRNLTFLKQANKSNGRNNSNSNLKNTLSYSSTVKAGKSFFGYKKSLNNLLLSPPKGMNFTFQAKTKSLNPKTKNSAKNFKYGSQSNKMKKDPNQSKNILNNSCAPSIINERIKGKIRNAVSSKRIRDCTYLISSNIPSNKFKSPLKDKSSNLNCKFEFPISNINALKYLNDSLTEYEKKEIIEFEVIYFIGKNKSKIVPGNECNKSNSNIYDDDDHNYQTVIGDHINYRYEVLQIIGKGSFGQALKCLDHKTKKYVAIKVLRNKRKYIYQTTVEVGVLSHLKKEDPEDISNTIKIIYFNFRNHVVELISVLYLSFLA